MISEKIKLLAEPNRSPLQTKQLNFAECASANWRTPAVEFQMANFSSAGYTGALNRIAIVFSHSNITHSLAECNREIGDIL